MFTKVRVFITLVLFAVLLTACTGGQTEIEENVFSTVLPEVQATEVSPATSVPTPSPLSQVTSEISSLLMELDGQEWETELEAQDEEVFWNLIQDGVTHRIGVFFSKNGEYIFQISSSTKTHAFSLSLLELDKNGLLVVTNENGLVIFEFHPGFDSRWVQIRDLPYLSKTIGEFLFVVGDSLQRSDGKGITNVVINDNFPPHLFSDPETGESIRLNSEERLSLAFEVSQVLTAQALDSEYSFSDLRDGRPYLIRNLDGVMYQVNPSKFPTFYLTIRQPPAEFYVYENIVNKMMFWWEVGVDGSLRLNVSYDLDDPILSYGGNVDILYRKSLLTMLLAQFVEPGEQISSGFEVYKDLLPSQESRDLSQLVVALINEIDQVKLAKRQESVGSMEIGFEPGINFGIDLFYTEK